MGFLQTVFVDGINDFPEKGPKSLGDEGELSVERVLKSPFENAYS
jgi:hypothetical protein